MDVVVLGMELTTVCAGRLGVGIVVVGVDTGGGGTVTDCGIGTPTKSSRANLLFQYIRAIHLFKGTYSNIFK